MNLFNIERAFIAKKEREWDTLYVAVDAHGTLIKPYHHSAQFYPGVVEVMKWFNSRPDFKVILWTSSHQKEIDELLLKAADEGFTFDFVNENPLEKNSERANFSRKFYFNILIEDKSGFDPITDWKLIKEELIRVGEWNRNLTK